LSARPHPFLNQNPEAEFLDKIQTKVLRVFLHAVHSHLYSFALRFIFLQSHATSYVFLQTYAASYKFLQFSYCTVLYKGERRKTGYCRKSYPFSYSLRNSYRNLTSENSQDYGQNPSTKLNVHEFGFWTDN
jgi:hypothetical protein